VALRCSAVAVSAASLAGRAIGARVADGAVPLRSRAYDTAADAVVRRAPGARLACLTIFRAIAVHRCRSAGRALRDAATAASRAGPAAELVRSADLAADSTVEVTSSIVARRSRIVDVSRARASRRRSGAAGTRCWSGTSRAGDWCGTACASCRSGAACTCRSCVDADILGPGPVGVVEGEIIASVCHYQTQSADVSHVHAGVRSFLTAVLDR